MKNRSYNADIEHHLWTWAKHLFVVLATALLYLLPSLPLSAWSQQVRLPNGEYTESSADLQVKTRGGYIGVWRSWAGGRWHVNPAWTGLAFTPDPLDQSVKTIERSGSLYQRSGTSDLYIFDGVFGDAVFIRRNGTGWRWFDRLGNWILYDARGRITAYGDANSLQVQFVLDAQGQRIAAQDALGNLLLTFTYRDDRLIAVQDRADRKILYTWVGDRLAQVTDARGGQWRYEYDPRGQLAKRTDPTGASVQIAYADSVQAPPPAMDSGKNAAQGMPASGIVTTSVPVSTAAGGPGRVGRLTDEAGTATLWNTTYDRTGRQYTVTTQLADSQTVVRRYDQDGRLTLQTVNGVDRIKLTREGSRIDRYTDARGLTNTIEYDGNRQPVKLTYPDGTADRFAYDTQGRPTQHTSALGTVTRLEYDGKGNLVKQTEAPGTPEERTTAWVYDAWGQPTETTTVAGGESVRLQARYDTWGNLSELTDAEGAVRRYSYNAMGQVLQQTDPLGFAWTAEYDPSGNPTKATDPLGHSRSWRHDAVGRTLQATDPLGQSVRYAYTPRGQTARYTDPLQQDWTTEYDPLGRWTKRSSPSGLAVQMAYDAEGRAARQTDPAGNVTQNVYGTAADGLQGLLAARVYPTYREEYRYDQRRRLTQRIAVLDPNSPDPDSPSNRQTARFGYDAMGQLVSYTAPDGTATLARYDAMGRKTQAIDALGGKIQQAWNVHSQPTALTDAAGNIHRFAYDKAGRVVKETKPGGGATLYTYDAAGQLTRRTEPAGNSARYTYDAAGRRTQVAYTAAGQSSPGQTVTTTYDAADRILAIRHSADSTTGAPAVQIAYLRDALGRKTQETVTYGGGNSAITQTLRYAYDADGNKTQLTYPDGSQQRYSYDKGRLASAQLPNGQTIGWSGWRWNAPTQVAFPHATQTLAYDPLQRLRSSQVSGADGRLLDRGLTYDLAGNIAQRQTEAGNFAYAYDRLGRLTEATPPAALQRSAANPQGLPAERYTYDAVGNRTSSAHQPGAWAYGADNELLQWGTGAEQTRLRYNANGNLQQQSYAGQTRTHRYDATDRLVGIDDEQGNSARYAYDPLGRRIRKTVGTAGGGSEVTTWYVYSDEGLIAELDGQGAMKRSYGWVPDAMWGTAPLWQAEASTGAGNQSSTLATADYHYLHTDHLGTPQAATDAQGRSSWSAQSEAFGKTTPSTSSRLEMNLRLPGQYFDGESRTHYNRFRDYAPGTGRYVQEDPIGLLGGWNKQAYASANPAKRSDPLGLLDCVSTGFYTRCVQPPLFNPDNPYPQSPNPGISIPSLDPRLPINTIPTAIRLIYEACKNAADWKFSEGADGGDKPSLLDPQGERHILDGDKTGGGHRPGTGKPGKSEFPSGWSDDRIKGEISDVATDPASSRSPGRNGREVVQGNRDGVDIEVIVEPNGRIVTGYPTNVPRNPR